MPTICCGAETTTFNVTLPESGTRTRCNACALEVDKDGMPYGAEIIDGCLVMTYSGDSA